MTDTLYVRRAQADDMDTIIRLITQAAVWLRTKGTDQWARPWPSRRARDERVLRGLRKGRTLLAEDSGGRAVATITCRRHGNDELWSPDWQRDPAVYVSRLIVNRDFEGQGIGAAFIDWAGLCALRDWDAQWIRIDVWTNNVALHNYYEKRGFEFCKVAEFLPDRPTYPSAALFQKPICRIKRNLVPHFEPTYLNLEIRSMAPAAQRVTVLV